MVRVCFAEDCSRPHHVFGCVFHREKAVYCDDCQHSQPQIYHACSIRIAAPSVEDSTHGLCRECAQLMKRHIRKHLGAAGAKRKSAEL
jgi:hypothetical protein